MNKFIGLCCACLFFFTSLYAQPTRYIVRFKHKGGTVHTLNNPSAFVTQRAIDRRTRYSIALDSSDIPVPATFITQLRSIPNVTVLNVSRWLNAATIQTSDANALAAIQSLPFVQSSSSVAAKSGTRYKRKIEDEILPLDLSRQDDSHEMAANYFNYGTGLSLSEIHLHNGEFLHNAGLRGQGMQIAMLDGGFFQYTTLDAFDSANTNNQFLSTWDFVSREQSVVEDNSHGMSCLSTIAANIPGIFIGKAPKASFHLFKTEDVVSEYPIEEFNWACGAERADSVGADVISSSLGYGYEFDGGFPDYPYSNLNGDITVSAQAADLAARKGLMVFNSAGNSGNDYWKMISTPADGDSVVAVGAVSVAGLVGTFSSYGPSPDGRVKPDVASVGVNALVQTAANTVAGSNGTSFSCPKMAGLATCLWQGFPEFNNMRIVRALKEAGSIYQTPNNRIGYGIPDMKKAFGMLLSEFATSSATVADCKVTLRWTSKDVSAMRYEIEGKYPTEPGYKLIATVNPNQSSILRNCTYEQIFSLDSMPAGTISYRIRQVIDTATAAFTAVYIDTSDVVLTSPCISVNGVRVAPNPVSGASANLLVETAGAVNNLQIALFDMKGGLLSSINRSKSAGLSIVSLPIAHLASGAYIVKVFANGKLLGSTTLRKL